MADCIPGELLTVKYLDGTGYEDLTGVASFTIPGFTQEAVRCDGISDTESKSRTSKKRVYEPGEFVLDWDPDNEYHADIEASQGEAIGLQVSTIDDTPTVYEMTVYISGFTPGAQSRDGATNLTATVPFVVWSLEKNPA